MTVKSTVIKLTYFFLSFRSLVNYEKNRILKKFTDPF